MKLLQTVALAATLVFAYPPEAESQRSVDVRFGILDAGDGRFIETTVVPNVVGQRFGWILTIATGDEPVPWSEELSLPRPPREWVVAEDDPDVAISDDRKIALTRGVLAPYMGEYSHFWGVSPGDPAGIYTVVVKVSDGVVGEADLELVDP
jgi:hypothetical protein